MDMAQLRRDVAFWRNQRDTADQVRMRAHGEEIGRAIDRWEKAVGKLAEAEYALKEAEYFAKQAQVAGKQDK